MLVDTDVLIWSLRGHRPAEELLQTLDGFSLSAVSYMELVQGLRSTREFRALRQALRFWPARIIALDADTSSRAVNLVEQHALSDGLRMADALIAATAMGRGESLLTANRKHYAPISGLDLRVFQPGGA